MRPVPIRSPAHRLRHLWADRIHPDAYLGLHLTVSLAGIALCTWAFGALLDAVLDNARLVQWDVATDLAIHRHMTPPSLRLVDLATQFGAPVTMVVLCIVVAAALWRQHQRTSALGWIAAFVGGAAVGQLFKTMIHRTRPVYGAAYLHGHSFSFPSGHAMGSMIGYGMLAWLVRHAWHARRARRRAAAIAAAILILVIGTSRILLGVHYPSDVLGGWAIGAAWMWVCITAIEITEHRHLDRARRLGEGTFAPAEWQAAGRDASQRPEG